jgi:hypothetical protein
VRPPRCLMLLITARISSALLVPQEKKRGRARTIRPPLVSPLLFAIFAPAVAKVYIVSFRSHDERRPSKSAKRRIRICEWNIQKLTYGAHCHPVNTSERNLLSENIPLLVASFEGIFIHHSARSSESPCWHIPCEFTATRAGNSRNQKTEGRQ